MNLDIETPIVDFVKKYNSRNPIRLHMPGHKGNDYLGFEHLDITEIIGADNLYSNNYDGIIGESELNATRLFNTHRTMYSTGGSTQCIGAMLYLAMINKENDSNIILAGRNAHKSFVEACGLLEIQPYWIFGASSHLCNCKITPSELDETLKILDEKPIGVYITSPDYLGNIADIAGLSAICKLHDVPLLVDNAHGSYLNFLPTNIHPIQLGADICCDSAHKTLPVVTGGAYLHFARGKYGKWAEDGKKAMGIFGSTSPSYLILQSLDNCNKIIAKNIYKQQLEFCIQYIDNLKEYLKKNFIPILDTEPLKLVIDCSTIGIWGESLEEYFKKGNIEPEWIDGKYIVFMFTPEITEEEFIKLQDFLYELLWVNKDKVATNNQATSIIPCPKCEAVMTVREALMSKGERLHISRCRNRICQTATVSCPPAVPIVVSGERITEEHLQVFLQYNVQYIDVISVEPLDLTPVMGLMSKYNVDLQEIKRKKEEAIKNKQK